MLLPPQHIGEGEQGFCQPFPAGDWSCLLSCCWRQGLYSPGTGQGGEGRGRAWLEAASLLGEGSQGVLTSIFSSKMNRTSSVIIILSSSTF